MNKTSPGLPVHEVELGAAQGLLDNLYALDYIKYSTMKRTLLLMPLGASIDEVVELAKKYCKKRSVTFSYVELAITDLSNEE